jgi:hypothetical protein
VELGQGIRVLDTKNRAQRSSSILCRLWLLTEEHDQRDSIEAWVWHKLQKHFVHNPKTGFSELTKIVLCWRSLASPLRWHKRQQWQRCLLAPTSITAGFTPLVMGLGGVWGKTHDHRKVRKRMNYRCSTSPGGIRVVDLYFPKGGTTAKMIE